MKCLAKRPADRWQTAEELLAQLEPLVASSGGITPTTTRPLPATPAPARGVPRWVGWMIGGALVAGGALALTLTQRAAERAGDRKTHGRGGVARLGGLALPFAGRKDDHVYGDRSADEHAVRAADRRGLADPPRRLRARVERGGAGVAGRHQDPLPRARRPVPHAGTWRTAASRRRRQRRQRGDRLGRLVAGRQAHRLPPERHAVRPGAGRPRQGRSRERNRRPLAGLVARRPLDRLRRGQPDVSLQREHGLVRDPSRFGRRRSGGYGRRVRRAQHEPGVDTGKALTAVHLGSPGRP